MFELKAFRRLGFRHLLLQFLNFASVMASGLMLWKGRGLFLNTESPTIVVLKYAYVPSFYRGDLLFLTNPASEHYHTGDIAMYRIPGADIPIVHRVIEARDELIATYSHPRLAKLKLSPGEHQLLLTKGDNNHVGEIELYWGLDWLERRHIVGKVRGYFLPYISYVTIAINDFPQLNLLKYALLGGLGLLALIQRE
ncbi:hypothetical protein K503DRAFT_694935 [Rhizopogon vinicolor AM-OR11-026]|uniref:Signal peptidase complex catalytic subunit SEC11 n=1 Tax=Rhizopogon vinicolor AM-OR11-026 TaxID=1314800 RepID=A0A1B7MVD9_9AGAM|nr:hypothetical protein K503DRAFT_694935 [Rhizopogon vinicolor AM-OR11-026]